MLYGIRVPKGFISEDTLSDKPEGQAAPGKSGLTVKVLKIPLNSGETEILITNIGAEKPGYEAFAGLYRLRRGVETKCKTVKQKPEPENFSGLPADNIRQDFYAMMTVANMISGAVRLANTDAKKEREGKQNRYEYQYAGKNKNI